MPLRKRITVLMTIVITSLALVSAALADPATPNPQSSCSADGNAGSGNIVFKDGTLVLTGCHSGDSSFDETIVVRSGTCHGAINSQVENIVCTKQ